MSTNKHSASSATLAVEASAGAESMVRIARLLQLSDSAFPVGTFSFSNGLESAIQTGIVTDKVSLQQFVELVVQQAASMDAVALLHAFRCAKKMDYSGIVTADQALWNRRVGSEQQLMLTRMGKKLAELCLKIDTFPLLDQWLSGINAGTTVGCYPIGQAIAYAQLGATENEAFAAHQFGVASMLLSAALRLMRIDHIDTQSILFSVQGRLAEDYLVASQRKLDEMSVYAPVFDVLVAHHTKAHVRLFMN